MHFCHTKTFCPLHDLALFFKPICYSHTHLVKLTYLISQPKIFIRLFLLVTVPSVSDDCSNETCLHHCQRINPITGDHVFVFMKHQQPAEFFEDGIHQLVCHYNTCLNVHVGSSSEPFCFNHNIPQNGFL
jgi:hypothetical protein